jgi:hypothetical protein
MPEKYAISALYYNWVTGELEKSMQVYEQWGLTLSKGLGSSPQSGGELLHTWTIREGLTRDP